MRSLDWRTWLIVRSEIVRWYLSTIKRLIYSFCWTNGLWSHRHLRTRTITFGRQLSDSNGWGFKFILVSLSGDRKGWVVLSSVGKMYIWVLRVSPRLQFIRELDVYITFNNYHEPTALLYLYLCVCKKGNTQSRISLPVPYTRSFISTL